MKRLFLMLTLAAQIALSALPAAAESAPAEIKIAHATWVGYGPLYIARERGFFADNGLDVELLVIEDESQYAAALASGNIDGLGNVLDREVIHFAKGTPETVIFAMDESAGGDGIVASAGVLSMDHLKGKTVGLDKSSTSYFFFLTALERAGVEEADVTIQEMGASDAGAAFVAGKLDAAVTWEPWLSKAGEREGGHVLASSKDYPRTIVDVLVLRKDVIDAHPAAPTGLARAWFAAVADYRENPAEGNAIMAKAMGLSAEEVADMARGVAFFGAEENQAFFRKDEPNNIYEVATRAGHFWKEMGIIPAPVDADALIDGQYVKAAAK